MKKAEGKIAKMSGKSGGSGSGNGSGSSKSKRGNEYVAEPKKRSKSNRISVVKNASPSSGNSHQRTATSGDAARSKTILGEGRSKVIQNEITSNTKRKSRETKNVQRIDQNKKRKIGPTSTGGTEKGIQSLPDSNTETPNKCTNASEDVNQNSAPQSVQKKNGKNSNDKMGSTNLLDRNNQIWDSELPFHVDVSAQKAFYISLKLDPPTEQYADNVNDTISMDEIVWTVKVGDTVAIHVDLDRAARNRVAKNLKGGYDLYPYTVTWWVAEVIAIYRNLSDNEAQVLRKKVSDSDRLTSLDEKNQELGSFQVEVRWLYRKVDIPGAFNRKTNPCDNIDGVNEVFETDDVDEISATALLGQVIVHSKENIPQDLPTSVNDMPVTHCFCQRAWSLYRKTLVPIGSGANRLQRGMLYSKFMSRGSATRAAFEEAISKNGTMNVDMGDKKQDWQEVFQDALSRLTLAKAAAVDCGTQLIGRTKEQKQIKKFLINAISAVNKEEKVDLSNSNKCSLFIGGPPGKFHIDKLKYIYLETANFMMG